MGIFDDAIREHLELKRHAGVDEEELKELEDEAFGPPARPGEPEFPGSTSEEVAVEAEGSAAPAVFDAETGESETPDDAVIEATPAEEPALTPIDEATVPETDDAPAEPQSEEPAAAAEAAFEEPATEVAEPAEPEETVAPDPVEESSFTTAEREAIADQPTVFFEQQPPEEFELGDLELDIDEEIEEVGGAVSEPLTDEEPLIVEEAFSEPAETEVVEPPLEPEPEPAPEPEADAPETSEFAPPAEESETSEGETGDEDVLEETPEFLRDNPDDDELWFEQGEPKDFDF
ncbi:MAG: hypothetical protein QOI31_1279 [Solirubrobacterales bacterium]|jgi:hypothetical protein|nr:hypothetical protein [Solirubrobacterales bacterium]